MARADIQLPLNKEVPVRLLKSLCRICGEKEALQETFLLVHQLFPVIIIPTLLQA
jgi:hypothetical protein